MVQPFTRTDFYRRAFRFLAPSVWNSLPQTVLDQRLSVCFYLFSNLKTFFIHSGFHWTLYPTCRQCL